MQKFLPAPHAGIIGNLGLKPEDVAGNYIESKLQKKYYVKPPNWDSAGESIELLAIHNDRENQEMFQMQKQMLEQQKCSNILQAINIKELTQRQAQLKEQFVEVNSFIKNCDKKKHNAEKRIEIEKNVQNSLKQNISQYQNMMYELGTLRTRMKNTLQEFEPYEKVIEEVVAQSDVYVSVSDCMARCDALMLAHSEIKSMQQEKLQEIEDMKTKMIKYTNEAGLAVMGLKNELANLERAYNLARFESLKWEKATANAKKVLTERELMKGRTLNIVQNIYKLLCRRREIEPQYTWRQFPEQLEFIKSEMEIIQGVVKQLNN